MEIGRRLAHEAPVEADLVIPTPESGTPAAIGYAQGSGIPYGQGLVKNAYVGRTFIQPSQTIRQLGIRLKLNPLRDVIRGKRLIVVDDSIVRGNTQRALVRMLRESGALEVHVRIASPPVRWPCFYGIDFATRAELVASGLDVEGVRGDRCRHPRLHLPRRADRGQRAAALRLCTACFAGDYPIALPEEARLGKHLLEDLVRAPDRTPAVDVSGAASGDPGPVSVPPADRSPMRVLRHPGARGRAGRHLNTLPSWGAVGALDRPDGPPAEHLGPPATPLRASTSTPVSAPSRPSAVRREGRPSRGARRHRRVRRAVRPRLGRYREPVLAASTDGVGTKVAVAQAVDKHDTIGLDLVAMVVDDLVVCGAEPLFLQDYIAVGKVVPEQIATIVSGIAEGCRQAGCALLGGETAEA